MVKFYILYTSNTFHDGLQSILNILGILRSLQVIPVRRQVRVCPKALLLSRLDDGFGGLRNAVAHSDHFPKSCLNTSNVWQDCRIGSRYYLEGSR